MKGIFVTGTSTAVGKTFVSRETISVLRSRGLDIVGVKPFETGFTEPLESDAHALASASRNVDLAVMPSFYRTRVPVAPLAAHMMTGEDAPDFEAVHQTLLSLDRPMLVEGAGGPMVPLSPKILMADFISQLGLGAIVVSRDELGTISHTLGAIEALSRRGVNVEAVVINRFPASESDISIQTNSQIIHDISGLSVYEWRLNEDREAFFMHVRNLLEQAVS